MPEILLFVFDMNTKFMTYTTLKGAEELGSYVETFLKIYRNQVPEPDLDVNTDSMVFFSWDLEPISRESTVEAVPYPHIVIAVRADKPDEGARLMKAIVEGMPERRQLLDDWLKQHPQNIPANVSAENEKKVFVVHGRNEQARAGMYRFLRSIGLEPMEWDDILSNLGIPSPYIGQVLDYAFSHAQAIVVLMTPDEDAQLAPMFHGSRDTAQDKGPAPQARPNVIFEAGMAMGRNELHTVIVEIGDIRPFSDIAGRLAVRLDNSMPKRQALATRLRAAGCSINLNGTDWHTEGDFSESIWRRNPVTNQEPSTLHVDDQQATRVFTPETMNNW